MGLKYLFGLEMMLPWWCFHMERNDDDDDESTSSLSSSSVVPPPLPLPVPVVRVVGSDGSVKLYDRPVFASEVTKEFLPTHHLICHSDSFLIGQKLPPLSHDEKLQLGNTYFVLPNHFFNSVLSFLKVATSLVLLNNNKNNSSSRRYLFDIHKTKEGMLQIRISEEKEEEEDINVIIKDTMEKEYNQLANRNKKKKNRREWKPTLDTIPEKMKMKMKMKKNWFPMQLLFRRYNN